MGLFITIFAPKTDRVFFHLLRRKAADSQNGQLCGLTCPISVICFSRISGGVSIDDVTSVTKSMTNYTRIYVCLGLKGLTNAYKNYSFCLKLSMKIWNRRLAEAQPLAHIFSIQTKSVKSSKRTSNIKICCSLRGPSSL